MRQFLIFGTCRFRIINGRARGGWIRKEHSGAINISLVSAFTWTEGLIKKKRDSQWKIYAVGEETDCSMLENKL